MATRTRAPITSLRTRNLREQYASTRLTVDRDAGIIRGVKVLGLASLNGRRYTPEAVKRAAPLYEGRAVNIDHPKRPSDERSSYDRFGRLVNVRVAEDGLYADLEYLKSHPMAERVCEAAERMPDAFGLSHNAEGRGKTVEGVFVVQEIVDVRHVDIVADPATTKSLSECTEKKMANAVVREDEMTPPEIAPAVEPEVPSGSSLLAGFRDEIMKIVDSENDWQSKKAMIGELLKLQDKALGLGKEPAAVEEQEDEEEDDEEEVESRRRQKKAKGTASLQEKQELARLQKQERALELCESAGIQPNLVLRKALASAKDDAEMKSILKEFQRTNGRWRPRSQAQGRAVTESQSGKPVTDGKTFAAAITRRN